MLIHHSKFAAHELDQQPLRRIQHRIQKRRPAVATPHHPGDGASQGRFKAPGKLFHILRSSGAWIYDVYYRT